MNWDKVIVEFSNKYGRSYLVRGNEAERNFLVKLMKPLLKGCKNGEIDIALGYACRTFPDKSSLQVILKCAEENVGRI